MLFETLIEEMGGTFDEEVVKIVSVENATEERVNIKVHKDQLEKILLHEDVKNLNIAVLSVSGEARIGKSFFIDRFRRFLLTLQVRFYRQNQKAFDPFPFGNKGLILTFINLHYATCDFQGSQTHQNCAATQSNQQKQSDGFKSSNSVDPCTTGIWAWSKIIKITRHDKKPVTIATILFCRGLLLAFYTFY